MGRRSAELCFAVALAALGCDERGAARASGSSSAGPGSPADRARRQEPPCAPTGRACAYEGQCTPAAAPSVEPVGAGSSGSAAPAVPCQAASDEDCKKARVCRDWGACSARAGVCVATRDEDCEASYIGRRAGQCSVDADAGRCVVENDADCKRAEVCVRERKCKAEEGWCKRP
ncbi:MAG: hypothetical protein IT373_20635 [Polyangiaceae bacterium]|nr:hypothetical protein [Polyangiaceae bacterium]